MAAATDIDTYKVILTLAAPEGVTRDELEETTLAVDDALREAGYEGPFGATASCTFEPMAIEIDLLIDAISEEIVDRREDEVLAAIKHIVPTSTDTEAVDVRRELVCA